MKKKTTRTTLRLCDEALEIIDQEIARRVELGLPGADMSNVVMDVMLERAPVWKNMAKRATSRPK